MGGDTPVADIEVDAMPIRGYNFIVNEWYLNENLQTYINYSTNPGADTTTPYALCYRNWQKDYFTSALPFSIRGDQVYLPWGNAPVVGTGMTLGLDNGTNTGSFHSGNGGGMVMCREGYGESVGASGQNRTPITNQKFFGVTTDPEKSGMVALNNMTGPSIDEVRVATRVSKWMQRNALNGVLF